MRVFDVACFGTSLTTSNVTREWQAELQNRLQTGASAIVRMYSVGSGGVASDWGIANVQRVIDTRARAAVIEFGINDAWTAKAISLSQSFANTRGIVQAIKAALPAMSIFLVTTNPALGAAAAERPLLASYYAQYATLATQESVGLVDNYPGWGASNTSEIPDGLHPALPALRAKHLPGLVAALRPLVG
jgi:hypothetical protein